MFSSNEMNARLARLIINPQAFSLLLISYLFISESNRHSIAAPFHLNCSSMQSYANARWRDNPKKTTFQNFENIQMYISDSLLSCKGGFIREASPLGVRVCEIKLEYSLDGKITWEALSGERTACRWQ